MTFEEFCTARDIKHRSAVYHLVEEAFTRGRIFELDQALKRTINTMDDEFAKLRGNIQMNRVLGGTEPNLPQQQVSSVSHAMTEIVARIALLHGSEKFEEIIRRASVANEPSHQHVATKIVLGGTRIFSICVHCATTNQEALKGVRHV
jgi:hypothetical protein